MSHLIIQKFYIQINGGHWKFNFAFKYITTLLDKNLSKIGNSKTRFGGGI